MRLFLLSLLICVPLLANYLLSLRKSSHMSHPNPHGTSILSREPKGSTEAGFLGQSYLSTPSSSSNDSGDPTTPTENAVVIFTDGSGLDIPNPMLIADELANRLNCDVWIPDYFLGRPIIPRDSVALPDRPGEKVPLRQWISFTFTVAIPNIGSIISNRPARVDPRAEEFVLKLKEERKYKKIGAVGYWYGGAVAIRLASKPGLLNTVVICDPGRFTVEQVAEFKIPSSWVCAEDDQWFPARLRSESERELESRKGKDTFVEYEFKTYKGTTHGFSIRPNENIPEVKKAFEDAFAQTVGWLNKTL